HETPMPAVFFGGRHLVLEHSLVAWEREGNGLPPWEERPHGGVQIAGASFDVRIEQCDIEGGFGAGITLGSRRFVPKSRMKLEGGIPKKGVIAPEVIREVATEYAVVAAELPLYTYVPTVVLSRDEEGCLDIDPDPLPSDDPQNPQIPVTEGPVVRVAIRHNTVSDMGGPGVFGMWGGSHYDMTHVIELVLDGNRIERCARLHLRARKSSLTQPSGGVILGIVDDAMLSSNTITSNGRPSGRPCFGVFTAVARSLRIVHNRIDDNGQASLDRPPKGLFPGGIVVLRAQPAASRSERGRDALGVLHARSALTVRDNEVVAPEGYALLVREALGSVDVSQNRLVSLHNAGADIDSTDRLAWDADGAVVTITGRYGSNRIAAELGDDKAIHRKAIQVNPFADARLSLVDNEILFEAPDGRVRSVAALMSPGAVRMSGNDVDVGEAVDVFATGFAVGTGVRFAHNSFAERSSNRKDRLSGYTEAQVNHTVDNQGIRCFAVGPGARLAIRDNLMPSGCDERKHGETIRDDWERFIGPGWSKANWWLDADAIRHVVTESLAVDHRLLIQAVWSAASSEVSEDGMATAVAAALDRFERQELVDTFDELSRGFADVGEEEVALAGRVVRDYANATVRIVDDQGHTVASTEVGANGRWRLRLPAGSEPKALRLRVATATALIHDAELDELRGGDRRFVELLGPRERPLG
ncbi:MAG: right-handed parallel beta-helix repeat-containing protein, partial [Myxococcales bacterium]|nr:right-handed parallel beta-helix repeat-containing protein [Myxococcales bacterium]